MMVIDTTESKQERMGAFRYNNSRLPVDKTAGYPRLTIVMQSEEK